MELTENKKFFEFKGYIARKEFCLNFIYLHILSTILTFPQSAYLINNCSTLSDLFSYNKILLAAPIYLKIYMFLSCALIAAIYIGNLFRRLNDLRGFEDKKLNIPLAVIFGAQTFWIFIYPPLVFVLGLLRLILNLILIFKKGKISGSKPHDITKDFNWGAFFGTWIWGLVNSSYKPLWILLLGFTPFSFYFSLICGLKGNAWAYKNAYWKDDEAFIKSQRKQTIIFTILNLVVVPLIIFVITFFIVGFIALGIMQTEANPQAGNTTKLEKAFDFLGSMYFDSYEITKNENKFYVNPSDWRGYGFDEKRNILEFAANTASIEKNKRRQKGSGEYYSKSTELNRTKIYSSLNQELLGEFYLDESIFSEKPDVRKIIKASMNSYKFYKPTQVK